MTKHDENGGDPDTGVEWCWCWSCKTCGCARPRPHYQHSADWRVYRHSVSGMLALLRWIAKDKKAA